MNNRINSRGQQSWTTGTTFKVSQGTVCQLCHAWLGSLGLEPTPFCQAAMQGQDCADQCYLGHLLQVADGLWRVLRDDGVMIWNHGDGYAGSWGNQGRKEYRGTQRPIHGPMIQQVHDERYPTNGHNTGKVPTGLKNKDLMNIPARFSIAMQSRGWTLRSTIPWIKGNSMPESVTDRPSVSTEMVFLFSKGPRYFFDSIAIQQSTLTPTYRTWKTATGQNHNDSLATLRHDGNRQGGGQLGDPSGRNRRTGDWWKESLDRLIADTDAWLAHAKQVRAHGGLLLSPEGEPLGLHVNPQPFSDWGETVRRVHVALDAVDGDTKCIRSPDCALHGDQPEMVPNTPYDGHASDNQSHSEHSDNHPSPSQPGGCVPTHQPDASDSADENLDWPALKCAPSATDHSTEMHKTAHAPATTQPYTPSAGMVHDTERRQALPLFGEHHHDSVESKPLQDDLAVHLPDKTIHNTVDNVLIEHVSSTPPCTCTYYKEVTDKTSHFATFPEDLIRPLIKSSTSERGCCGTCQAPWARVVERSYTNPGNRTTNGPRSLERRHETAGFPVRLEALTTTLGWHPTCTCHEHTTTEGWRASQWPLPESVPCTVLDPFLGSGTTALVTRNLGRRVVGIELSTAYLELAIKRLQQQVLPFAEVQAPARNGHDTMQAEMSFDV